MSLALLTWRNLLHNKLRTLLTGLAIAFSSALVSILLTMPDGFERVVSQLSSNTRVGVLAKAGVVYGLPASALNRVLSVPGVVDATSYTWFGGALDADSGISFPTFAVDADRVGVVFEDYDFDPDQLADFQRKRNAALVGVSTLEQNDWEVGDLVTLTSDLHLVSLEFEIVGVIPSPYNPNFFLRREYLEQALRAHGGDLDEIGMIWARVDAPERLEPAIAEIDVMFRNSPTETASQTEKAFTRDFFGFLEDVVTMITLVIALVTLAIVFIAANTVSLSVRERSREIAILKSLGFRQRTIFRMFLLEAMLLCLVSAALGTLAALGTTGWLRSAAEFNPQLSVIASFVVGPGILAQALLLFACVGIASGAIPSFARSRRGAVELLREVF